MAYNILGNTVTITRQDWLDSGLSGKQLADDSRRGLLRIYRRGRNGKTLLDLSSIERPERLERIEAYLGKIDDRFNALDKKVDKMEEAIAKLTKTNALLLSQMAALSGGRLTYVPTDGTGSNDRPALFPNPEHDLDARKYFCTYRKPNGKPLMPDIITKYANKCALLNAIGKGLDEHTKARAKAGKKVILRDFFKSATEWYIEQSVIFVCDPLTNQRSLEKLFKCYYNGDATPNYDVIIDSRNGNDNARVVSKRGQRLLVALSKTINAPTKERVSAMYNEFARGNKEFVDKKTTGEVFNPNDFKHNGRPMEISPATAWNYLKEILTDAATATHRKGAYAAKVEDKPFNFMHKPNFSLSKITMDDADLSRKMTNGKRVHRYAIQDVMSGYWFMPVYSREALTANDVIECLRNMFCELEQNGLPCPGEIEHENHLVRELMERGLREIFPFTTLSSHSINKKSERFIRDLKWTVADWNGHTRGRFYGKKHYKTPRIKAKGEFVEKGYGFDRIVYDDLQDIDEWNNASHPNRKLYDGMTRKEVFFAQVNPELKSLERWHLYRYIGNDTHTTIRNNNYLLCNNDKFLLDNYECLNLLSPNNREVTAYWLPDLNGHLEKVYLYQGDTYIGSATTVENYAYNEAKVERTDEDTHRLNIQLGRSSHFAKIINDINADLPNIAILNGSDAAMQSAAEKTVVITSTDKDDEDDYITIGKIDYAQKALLDF